jgi:hypothetical protein
MSALYYHDASRGKYHAVLHHGPGRWSVALDLDPATQVPATYTGMLPSLLAARRVMAHLAPEAVELPGLPAWLR